MHTARMYLFWIAIAILALIAISSLGWLRTWGPGYSLRSLVPLPFCQLIFKLELLIKKGAEAPLEVFKLKCL